MMMRLLKTLPLLMAACVSQVTCGFAFAPCDSHRRSLAVVTTNGKLHVARHLVGALSSSSEGSDTESSSALSTDPPKWSASQTDWHNESYLNNVAPGSYEPRKPLGKEFDAYEGSPYERAMSEFSFSGINGRRAQSTLTTQKEVSSSTDSGERWNAAPKKSKKPGEERPDGWGRLI